MKTNHSPRVVVIEVKGQYLVNAAFTLLELGIIVSIFIVLVALAFPAMSHTRNQSQIAVDVYNNRQLMAAVALYAADHNEVLPGNGWGTAYDCWAHAAGLPIYNGVDAAHFQTALSNQAEFCKRGQLYPYVRSLNIFKCPNDVTNRLYFQRNVLFTSYTWNGAVSAYGNLSSGAGSFKITQFKPNSILQWETDEQTPFFINDCSSFPDEGLSSRHGGGSTVGLISGGTQRIAVNQWYTYGYAGPRGNRGDATPRAFLPNPAWCNPGVRSGLQY
jgi:type II secretory pathway pseudopilin PulG